MHAGARARRPRAAVTPDRRRAALARRQARWRLLVRGRTPAAGWRGAAAVSAATERYGTMSLGNEYARGVCARLLRIGRVCVCACVCVCVCVCVGTRARVCFCAFVVRMLASLCEKVLLFGCAHAWKRSVDSLMLN